MNQQTAAATIQAYFEALNWGRIEEGVSLFGDATRWDVSPLKISFEGACGYLNYWGMWRGAAPQFWIEIESIKLANNWGAAQYTLRGIHSGVLQTPLGAICPSGREINLPITELYDALCGRFTRIHTSFCLADLMGQLGQAPEPRLSPLSMHLLN